MQIEMRGMTERVGKPDDHSESRARISESLYRTATSASACAHTCRDTHSTPAHDQIASYRRATHLLADFQTLAAERWQQDFVAGLDRRLDNLAVAIRRAGADGQHGRFRRRLGRRGCRQEDARGRFLSTMSIRFLDSSDPATLKRARSDAVDDPSAPRPA